MGSGDGVVNMDYLERGQNASMVSKSIEYRPRSTSNTRKGYTGSRLSVISIGEAYEEPGQRNGMETVLLQQYTDRLLLLYPIWFKYNVVSKSMVSAAAMGLRYPRWWAGCGNCALAVLRYELSIDLVAFEVD